MQATRVTTGTIVVVGASLAGIRAAEAARAEGFDGRIVVVGDEPHVPYDRPPLSKAVLLAEREPAETAVTVADGSDIEWRLGRRAAALDTRGRTVTTAGGETLSYDGLVVATGSRPRTLPGLDPDGDSVFVLRTADEALGLRSALRPGARLLIVGGGFIGVEVASAAVRRGLTVSMVSLDPPLIAAGPIVSGAASRMLGDAGVELSVGRTIAGHRRVSAGHDITLDDGTDLRADIVLVAIGAEPATDWLAGSGLSLGNGVRCDETLHAAPNVVAAGDVADWPNPSFGGRRMRIEHWSNAVEQGTAAGRALVRGPDAAPFGSIPSFWSDHFGVRLQSVGLPALAADFQVTDGDPGDGTFAAAGYRDGALVGAVAYAMPRALIRHRAALLAEAGA